MRKILFMLLLLPFIGRGQVFQDYKQYGSRFRQVLPINTLYFPVGCGTPSVLDSSYAAFYADTCNAIVYWYNPVTQAWDTLNAAAVAGANNYSTSQSFNTSTGDFTTNRNGLSALTTNLDGRYLLITDTTAKWVGSIYKRVDSFFYKIGSSEYFIGKDSSGVGSVDTTDIANFSVKVRSLFSATSPVIYSNGNFSLAGLTGVGSNGQLIQSNGSAWEYFTPSYLTSTNTGDSTFKLSVIDNTLKVYPYSAKQGINPGYAYFYNDATESNLPSFNNAIFLDGRLFAGSILWHANGSRNGSLGSTNDSTGIFSGSISFVEGFSNKNYTIKVQKRPDDNKIAYLPNENNVDTLATLYDLRTIGGGSGEANTASTLGGGLPVYDSKSGVDLRFNSLNANDFDLSSNLISIDYVNTQKASGSQSGALSSTDWNTFNGKETAFTETTEEFTGSTSLTITLSNTPKSGKAEMYYLNGIVIQQSNISRTGTGVTFSGFSRNASDIITTKYSY